MTSDTKGKMTPGPWHAQDTAGHDIHGQTAVYGETGKDIAIVYDGEANARAIAAVPELIAALQMALPLLAVYYPSEHKRAKAVLAKAGVL